MFDKSKLLTKKKEHHHGGSERRVQRHGYSKYSRPLASTSSRWARRGRCDGV